MKTIIACGGTGGHFYPGYALGLRLKEQGHVVLYIVRKDDPAKKHLEADSLPYAELDLRGMPRGLSLRWLIFPFQVLASLWRAQKILRAFRADIVVGMGGYITFPAAFAARLRGVPYILHESNAVLGLANRVCAGGAKALARGLVPADSISRPRTVLTGTPVRETLWKKGAPAAAREALGLKPDRKTLLIFGGSQGARVFNQTAPEALGILAQKYPEQFQVIHLSGYRDDAEVLARYKEIGTPLLWSVQAYAQNMETLYAAADLTLARAGASTLSELIVQRCPAVLIPYPFATADHQDKNARVLEKAGACHRLPESELTPESLMEKLDALFSEKDRLSQMTEAYASLEIPSARQSVEALAALVVEEAVS